MNKELINKYKPEFNHWLNEGKILYKHINSNAWWNNEPWDYFPDYITAIIIKDEYSEFRKALAEGKVIEHIGQSSNVWHEVQEPDFNLHPTCYRIKPDGPKFKVGDFVRYVYSTPAKGLEINNINGNRYYFTNSEMSCLEHELEPWTPVKGEWCWFYDRGCNKYAYVAQFKEINKQYFISNTGTYWQFCEPFLNSLPSYLKDK